MKINNKKIHTHNQKQKKNTYNSNNISNYNNRNDFFYKN